MGGTDDTAKYADGVQFAGSFQKGIPGTAFCGGDDCEVDEDGDLTGSWYFTPTVAEGVVRQDDDDDRWHRRYDLDTGNPVRSKFGHWLVDVDTGGSGDTGVNTFAVE